MKLCIKAITNTEQLQPIAAEFDDFVEKSSENPFLLSAFIKECPNLCNSKGSKPLILIIYDSNKIVGIAPLAIHRKFGISSAEFLFGPHFLPDIIVDNEYRHVCSASLLKYLFLKLRFSCIKLTFSNESPNLPTVREVSKRLHVYCGEKAASRHRVISVNCTWDEYLSFRGSNFRNRFRKIERKLNRLGNWEIVCTEKLETDPEICEKIREIEKASWKARWMSSQGIEEDLEIAMLFGAMCNVDENRQRFNWRSYILKFKNNDIAYVLVFRNKHTWFVKRTSYIERYKSLYPGLFVMNFAISDLFAEPHTKLIDFCTDHNYLEIWAKNRLDRTTLILSGSYMLSLVTRVIATSSLRHVWSVIFKYMPKSFRTFVTTHSRGLLW